MPNSNQVRTYRFIRDEIARLRGARSYVPLSLETVSSLTDEGQRALFRVNGARVFITSEGTIRDQDLPDCPTYAPRLLPKHFLPAITADLLMKGNPHKTYLHD